MHSSTNIDTDTEEECSLHKSKGLEWKALLLLQFQSQFQIAIMLSIYFAYSCCVIDLAMAYGAQPDNITFSYAGTGLSVIFCCDIMYAIDIALMMSYRNIQWSEVERLHDKRSTLAIVLDIISIIPWDAFYVSLDEINMKTVYVLRLRYALRVFRFLHRIKKLKDVVKVHKMSIELLDYAISYTLLLTTLSCIFYIIICQTKICPYQELNPLLLAFYNINGLLIFQQNVTDVNFGALFNIWLITINLSSFLYFMGVVVNRWILVKIQNYERKQMFSSLERSALSSLLACKRVDWGLVSTCKAYFRLLWKTRYGIIFDNVNMKIIPAGMAKEVNLDISWDSLNHSHLFRETQLEFLRLISPYVKQTFLMPGEVVFKRNHLKSQMVYIVSGVIQILSEQDGETPILSLSGGTCIGESSLVFDYPSTYTVICQSACEASILKRKDFLKAYLRCPNMYKVFLKNINSRYSETKKYYNAISRWNGTQKERETLILKWLKATLQELMASKNILKDNFSALAVYNTENNAIFCTKYLDLLVITEKLELITDIVFVRDACPCILQPDSFIVKVWDKIIEATAFAFMAIYPYYASFEPNAPIWYFILSYLVLALWILDIFVAFSTAVKDKDRFLATIKEIALARIQNPHFFLDLVSTIPLELIVYFIDNPVDTQRIVLLQILRLVKCYKIENLFRNSELSIIEQTYVKFVVYLLLLIYYLAALLYLKSCYNSVCASNDFFLMIARNLSNNSNDVIFIYASLLTQKLTSTGSTKSLEEDNKLLLSRVMMDWMPSFFYMYFISSAVATETLSRFDQLKGKIFITDIKTMIRRLNIKPHISNLVVEHIQNQLEQNHGVNYKSSYKTLEQKHHPLILQSIHMSTFGSVLKSLPLFSNLPKTIIPEIAGKCRNLMLGPNEVVTFAGETCEEIYIIFKGYCKVVSSTETSTSVLKDNYAVLSALEMFLDVPVARTVVTLTHCNLIVIPCNELVKVLVRYPKILSKYQNAAQLAYESMFFDLRKEACDYVLDTTNVDQSPSFKHFGYYLSNDTKEGIDYHKKFDELETFGFIRYLLLRHTIKTDGTFLKHWEISRCIFAFATAILTPIIPISMCSKCAWFYLLFALDVTAWIDIYIRHHVCYFNKENIEVTHPLKTAIHYWKNAFLIDILGVFPLDGLIISFFDIEDTSNNRVFIKMIKMLQTYRIFRGIAHLNKLISSQETWAVLQYLPLTILLINTVGTTIINGNCKFDSSIEPSQNYTNGTFCPPNMWLSRSLFIKPLSPLRIYFYGYFYAMITTAGPPLQNLHMNMKEIAQAALIGILGYTYFVYVSAKIITSSIYRNIDSTLHQQTISGLIDFLSCRRLDVVLKQEILAHFEYVFEIQQRKNMRKLIKEIGGTLEAEILLDQFGDAVKESVVFGSTTDSFLKTLLVKMDHKMILNRGIICKVNDIHNKIYFIVKGHVDVLSADYNHLLLLPKGSLFGNLNDTSLTRQKLTMVAKGHVELLSISSPDFHRLLRSHARMKNKFEKLILFNTDYILESPMQPVEERASSILAVSNIAILHVVEESTVWEIFIIAIVCYLGCLVELYLITMQDHTVVEIMFVYFCDLLFIINMYFNFHFKYKDEYGIVITDKKKIARRYMTKRLGFYFALASVLPFELVSLFFIKHDMALTRTVWNNCRANRLLKIFILVHYLNKIASQLSTNMIISTVTLGVWISLIIQILTSTVITISCATPQFNLNPLVECNWTNTTSTVKFNIYIEQYASITSIFTGTVLLQSPNSPVLILFFLTLLIAIKFLAVLIIKQIAAVLDLLLHNKLEYERTTYELKHYMTCRGTSSALANRVRVYINFLWKQKKGHQFPILLEETPYYLREAVLNSLYGYLLRRHPVFCLCHVDLIRQISSKMRPLTFLYGDYVAFKNDIDECMYFVHEGSVDAISKESTDSEKIVKTINSGEVFGYQPGLYPCRPHHYTYRANQLTVIVVLKRHDWIYLLDFFPASKTIMINR